MSRISDRLQHCLLGLPSREFSLFTAGVCSLRTVFCITDPRVTPTMTFSSSPTKVRCKCCTWEPRDQQLIKVIKNNSAKQEKLHSFNKGDKHKGPGYKTLHCHTEIPLSQLNLASHSLSKRVLYIYYYWVGSKIFIACGMFLYIFGSLFPGNIFFLI